MFPMCQARADRDVSGLDGDDGRLSSKVVHLWKRDHSVERWPSWAYVLSFRDGLLHVRSLDPEDAGHSWEHRARFWIPISSIQCVEVVDWEEVKASGVDILTL